MLPSLGPRRKALSIAALLVALAAASFSHRADAQTRTDTHDAPEVTARQHHRAGVALFDAATPNYESAMAEFVRAYELLAEHPRRFYELSNIGHCLRAMGRYAEAIEYYRRYLDEGGSREENRPEIESIVTNLASLLATIEVVDVPEGADASIDGEPLVGRARSRVAPGRHVVTVRAPGYASVRDAFVLAAGDIHVTRGALTPVRDTRPSAAWFWSLTLSSAAGLVAWGVLGAVALAEGDDVRSRLESPDARSRLLVTEADVARVKSLALAADVALGVAALTGVAAVTLGVLRAVRATPRVTLGVASVRGGGGIVLGGSF